MGLQLQLRLRDLERLASEANIGVPNILPPAGLSLGFDVGALDVSAASEITEPAGGRTHVARERMPDCPKCGRVMEPGFLLDMTHGGMTQTSWVQGAPEKSFWTGIRIKGRTKLPVKTFRCTHCGYLESYATSS
jgi:hypothetical protein